MNLEIKKNYPFLIALYLTVAVILHNYQNINLIPNRKAMGNITWYSLFFALGSFIGFIYLSSCNIPYISILLICVLVLMVRWIVCISCRESYSVATQYAITIPILTFIFPCNQLSIIVTAIAIATAFGRIGCICAGCCTGKQTNNQDFHYTYSDPNQIINVKRNQKQTITKPTIIYEAIIQFCIAGFCLHFIEYAPLIYGIGTSLLLIATKYWRMEKRENISLGILAMLILIYKCYYKINGICLDNKESELLKPLLICMLIVYFVSYDLFSKKIENFIHRNKGVSNTSLDFPNSGVCSL